MIKNKRAQVSIFIILSILIIVGAGIYIVFKSQTSLEVLIPKELESVYSYYLSCLEEEGLNGILILGQQGGYIENPEFFPGNEYMPFSSQLNFLGNGVPYWYYISGNGVSKEQIPSKEKMEFELNNFLKERTTICDFSEFEKQGFEINVGEAEVKSSINDNSVEMKINQELSIKFGELSWNGNEHSVKIDSNLGKFYELARKIYDYNKKNMFLENYGLDILRLNAPVDGSEIGCSPKIWGIENIRDELMNALKLNVPEIKIKGNYYERSADKYFVNNIGENSKVDINFMYSEEWPMKLEAWPSEEGVLRADPVGLQEGLGMLGFCYVPYHFVYDFAYPVLIQLYSETEMFQFPVVVLIDKNMPREALDAEGLPDVVPELCTKKNTAIRVNTYNTELEPIEAGIKFKCFDTSCDIGETKMENGEAVLAANFPQCVNGFVIASAEGYETKKEIISSVESQNIIMILDKKYKLGLETRRGGIEAEYAVVSFIKDNKTLSVSYPEQKEVELSAGQYEIKVYDYSNSSIQLKGSTNQKCVSVPKTGILGIFGVEDEKCFEITIPDQIVSFAVSGGGKQEYYIAESELQNSNKIIIDSPSFGIPREVGDLQENFNRIEISSLDISFE